MMNEEKLRKHIRKILLEEREYRKGDVVVSGARGRPSKLTMEAGALAQSNPKQLMKNLNVSSSQRGNLDGLSSLLKQALTGTEAMKRAFGTTKLVQSKNDLKGVQVAQGELKLGTAAKFLNYSLVGAIKAGIISPEEVIQVKVLSGTGLVVYLSKTKSWESR